MRIPPESEIREAAKTLGHADANGDYPLSLRKKIVAAINEADKEVADTAKAQPNGTTAEQLLAFHDELTNSRVPNEDARALTLAVASALVRRQGLLTKGTRTHDRT